MLFFFFYFIYLCLYVFIYILTHVLQTFHGCTCIQSWGLTSGNSSAVLGQCPRESSCTKMFYIYLALQSLAFFVYCLGTVPFFLISLRYCLICFHHIVMQLLHLLVPYFQLHLLYLIPFQILYNLLCLNKQTSCELVNLKSQFENPTHNVLRPAINYINNLI